MRNFADAVSEADLVDARDSDVEPETEKTHYIPAFTVVIFRGRAPRRQQAACGEYVEASAHSNEPTCHGCATWVQQEADDTAETAAALGFVIENGLMLPRDAR